MNSFIQENETYSGRIWLGKRTIFNAGLTVGEGGGGGNEKRKGA